MNAQAPNKESESMEPVKEAVPMHVKEEMAASPSVQESCRFTRSMARSSVSGLNFSL